MLEIRGNTTPANHCLTVTLQGLLELLDVKAPWALTLSIQVDQRLTKWRGFGRSACSCRRTVRLDVTRQEALEPYMMLWPEPELGQ